MLALVASIHVFSSAANEDVDGRNILGLDPRTSHDGARHEGETAAYGQRTRGGMDDRIDSTLPPVRNPNSVPRS